VVNGHASNGLRIPAKFDPTPLLKSPRFGVHKALLQLTGAESGTTASKSTMFLR
jgi:hypothetical protein